MIETWQQYTCDACGETEYYPAPNATRKDVRVDLRKGGWQSIGTLDYCPECVKRGFAKRRITGFSG